MRKILLYIHLWCGLTAALLLLLLGTTGALIAFEDEIDRALNAKLTYVQPIGQPLTLTAITQKLLERYPGARIEGFQLPQRPDLSLFVGLTDASGKETLLFLNPYTAEILGTAAESNRLMSRVHQFHTHLLAGQVGKQIMGWSGVLLLVLSITGIVLWWPTKLFRLRWSGSGKRFNFELHNTVGVLSSVFLFLFAWTAACIHWEREVGNLAQKISKAPPAHPAALQVSKPGAQPLSADRLLEIAHNALPEARIMDLELPRSPKQPAALALKFPEDHTPLGRTRMRIDAYSGKVLQLQSSRDFAPAMKYARMWNRELHTGDILNLPTRILAAFFSLMLPVLALTGPLIWWNRRKANSAKSAAA
jgi:uncharacterized iron-regulated membrane protein